MALAKIYQGLSFDVDFCYGYIFFRTRARCGKVGTRRIRKISAKNTFPLRGGGRWVGGGGGRVEKRYRGRKIFIKLMGFGCFTGGNGAGLKLGLLFLASSSDHRFIIGFGRLNGFFLNIFSQFRRG